MIENELFLRVPNKNPVGSFGAFFSPRISQQYDLLLKES